MTSPPLHLFGEACAATYASNSIPFFATKDVQVYLSEIGGRPCFRFEGTHDLRGWLIDFLIAAFPVRHHPKFGPVHDGFADNAETAVVPITAYLATQNFPGYYLSGHSKGASEALIAHAIMKDSGHPPLATRAFEPARPGGPQLEAFLSGEDIVWTRTKNSRGVDLVTDVAFGPMLTDPLVTWCHIGEPTVLTVPDALDIPQKHEMAAVLAALPVG